MRPCELLTRHKKSVFLAGGLLLVILAALYLWVLFRPGFWYDGVFLARRQTGIFTGQNSRAAYSLSVSRTPMQAELSFSLNGETRNYRVLFSEQPFSTRIYENDALVFTGEAIPAGDFYLLTAREDMYNLDSIIQIQVSEAEEPEPKFPGLGQIYTWAMAGKCETYGSPMFLLPSLLLAASLALDIRFPDLAFHVRHGLDVDGGEPSDWYRTGQKIGRVILVLAMLYCMGASLFTH